MWRDEDYDRAREILQALVPAVGEPKLETPMSMVFLAGVMLIFGGMALGSLSVLLTGVSDFLIQEKPFPYMMVMISGAMAAGAMWIIGANVRQWRRQRD